MSTSGSYTISRNLSVAELQTRTVAFINRRALVLHAAISDAATRTRLAGSDMSPIVLRDRLFSPPHSCVFMPNSPVKKVSGRKITVNVVKIMTLLLCALARSA